MRRGDGQAPDTRTPQGPPLRVKVHGAGSIGNHLAHAARTLGWTVTVCDVSEAALDRMRGEIYPGRYGRWDDAIRLVPSGQAPRGEFDLVCVGTPPDTHIALAREAVGEGAPAVLVEKPACPPHLEGAAALASEAEARGTRVFVGYDHVVGQAARHAESLMREGAIGEVETLDVEFREHWEGIFRAHPWLSGPADTYLGYWRRGGGASGEHSHALNLWQHFAHAAGGGRVAQVSAAISYAREGEADYDRLCAMSLRAESGLVGRVIQDVLTRPARKRATIQGKEGAIEWVNGFSPEGDAVLVHRAGAPVETRVFAKTRPDDFIEELAHVAEAVRTRTPSPLALARGLDTAVVIAAAHESEHAGRRVVLDWAAGPRPEALR
jgi:predicted dehydrogenase